MNDGSAIYKCSLSDNEPQIMDSNDELPDLRPMHDVCVMQRENTPLSTLLIYAFVVPTLATFGLCANLINAIVFMRPKMTPSAFSYLAALSWLDCISCFLITLTAISRSFFYNDPVWIGYDYEWQTPLFGITTGAANLILACLSCDRLAYLRHCTSALSAPRFCSRKVAHCMIVIAIIISIVVNLPFFFVFSVESDGTCIATEFYYSTLYKVHNWFAFVLLAILPAIFLLIGNTAIIIVFQRWNKQQHRLQNQQQTCSWTAKKRYQHQMKLTITILIVITLYMIGELPAHMTSRKNSLNLLFGGDVNKVNPDVMSKLEVICITLNALQLSMNIVVYAVINPSFMPEFFICLKAVSDACCRLCCLTALERSCHKRCIDTEPDTTVIAEAQNCAAVAQAMHVPAQTTTPECGCDSWSTDSECEAEIHAKKRSALARAASTKTLTSRHSSSIFATETSGCAFEHVVILKLEADNKSDTEADKIDEGFIIVS